LGLGGNDLLGPNPTGKCKNRGETQEKDFFVRKKSANSAGSSRTPSQEKTNRSTTTIASNRWLCFMEGRRTGKRLRMKENF